MTPSTTLAARTVAAARAPSAVERVARTLVLARLATLAVGSLEIHEAWSGEKIVLRGRLGPTEDGLGDASRLPPAPDAALRVVDPAFYADMLAGGSLGAAESYLDASWTSDDLVALVRLFVRNRSVLDAVEGGLARLASPLRALWARMRRNTKQGSRRNIAAHYDLGNDFFELFLDETLTYSAGVFEHAGATMREASLAKLDRLCRKLDLRPQHHLLEIGTGWGSMAIHAAATYGCRVTTTTISQEQHALAVERVARAGLSDRVTVLLEDYRDLRGRYDRLVSVEMIEAVGREFLPTWMETCSRLLAADGLFALQAIHILDREFERAAREVDFIKRHVFPGSFIPSVTAICDAMAQRTDMRLVHLEDMTPHYARTLGAWRETLHDNRERVLSTGRDERFLRLWDYYLAYCEGGFAERFIGVSQLVLAKPLNRRDPILPAREALGGRPSGEGAR
ncbi:MAG: class I SAM-dependent methyltransferase [Planctomycetes bacterium]|nr:class I SAM-dependent methyltransferase [Planctomycetota bacterium]